MNRPIPLADLLNQRCACVTLDRARLHAALCETPDDGAMLAMIEDARPHLFSDTAVYLRQDQAERIAQLVAAVERIVGLPGWRDATEAGAPPVACVHGASRGVFLGYDFHLDAAEPQLIEINTNAGGGLLNAFLARAQVACCPAFPGEQVAGRAEAAFLAMFQAEWSSQRGERPLRTLAIVDEAPQDQYLLPEFLLFQRLFQRAGIAAHICDPAQLELRDGRLCLGDATIDLVYNRSTDFHFETDASRVLREAWLSDAAVITPHPAAHARYADKRNLVRLSDPAFLRGIGAAATDIALCQAMVPPTEAVSAAAADSLWARRKELFFKPAAGFGSRAAYRGEKLTRRVFGEILAGNYVAQRLTPPSERTRSIAGERMPLKLDLRAYAYAGQVQLMAARLYRGQTTNFRTPGGGFAAVITVNELQDGDMPCALD